MDQYLGWRSIFWFLVIFAGVLLLFSSILFPETCRAVVGDGSIPPQKWNYSLWAYLHQRRLKKRGMGIDQHRSSVQPERRRRPNPLASVLIVAEKEAGLILAYGALLYAGYIAVLSTLTSELHTRYGFDSLKIGLCYLPIGCGSLTSRFTVGRLLDRNFKRHAARQGLEIVKNRQQNIDNFNIELARLQLASPLTYLASISIIAYGWVMEYRTPLAGPLVVLFFVGHFTTGGFSTLNTLVVDTHRETPATATAANNLLRCLLGAGAAAVSTPLINRIGIGWAGTSIAFPWVLFSPSLYAVLRWGPQWRIEKRLKTNEKMVGQTFLFS